MKRAFLLLSLAFYPFSGFASKPVEPPPVLSLAATQWAPYTGKIGDSRVAYELVEEALSRVGYDASLKVIEEGLLSEALVAGEFDGSPAFWRNAPRARFLLFSKPFLENRLVLVGRKGADVSAASLSDLEGKRLGLVRAYAYGEELEAAETIERVFSESQRENLQGLIEGKVDYVLLDALLVQYLIEYKASETDEYLAIGKTPLIRRSLHFVLNPEVEDAAAIMEAFNAVIPEMVKDGTFHRILQLNWIQADMDGDGTFELVLGGNKAGESAPGSSYELSPLKESVLQNPAPDRYWIEGEVYDNWDDVPERYKIEESRFRDPSNTGISVLQVDF